MKISATYRFSALLLCFSIFAGVTLPGGLHAKSAEVCDDTEATHADHQMPAAHDDCPMEAQHRTAKAHHPLIEMGAGMHDFSFACSCSIEEAPVQTEAQVLQKTKVLVLSVTAFIVENHTNEKESDNHAILISDSYSPPPIFLVQESFLI